MFCPRGSRHTVATTDEGLTGVNDLGLWDLILVKEGLCCK